MPLTGARKKLNGGVPTLRFRAVLPLISALATSLSILVVATPLIYKIYEMARGAAKQAVALQSERAASAVGHEVLLIANRAMDLSRNVDVQRAAGGGPSVHTVASYLQEFSSHNKEVWAAFVFRPDAAEVIAAWPPEAAASARAPIPAAWREVAAAPESWTPQHSSYQVLSLEDPSYLEALERSRAAALPPREALVHSAHLFVFLVPIGADRQHPRPVAAFVVPVEAMIENLWHFAEPDGRLGLQVEGNDLATLPDGAPLIPASNAWIPGQAEVTLTHVRDHPRYKVATLVARPAADYGTDVRQSVYVVGLLVAGMLALTAGATYGLASRLLRPLSRLTALAAAYGAGDYTAPGGELPFVEWQALQTTLQSLGAKIRAQIEAAAATERRHGELTRASVESDLRALREQMQPHFIFNVLNNIRVLMAEDAVLAGRMLDSLADLYRLIVEASTHATHALAAELAVVERYLALQAMRFEARLQYEILVPEAFRTLSVPSLALQTLVENAVKHGIATVREGGKIWVEAVADGEAGCLLTIVNTGARLMTPVVPGIGLINTRRRFELLYGPGHGPDLERDAAGRTCVRLRLTGRTL